MSNSFLLLFLINSSVPVFNFAINRCFNYNILDLVMNYDMWTDPMSINELVHMKMWWKSSALKYNKKKKTMFDVSILTLYLEYVRFMRWHGNGHRTETKLHCSHSFDFYLIHALCDSNHFSLKLTVNILCIRWVHSFLFGFSLAIHPVYIQITQRINRKKMFWV